MRYKTKKILEQTAEVAKLGAATTGGMVAYYWLYPPCEPGPSEVNEIHVDKMTMINVEVEDENPEEETEEENPEEETEKPEEPEDFAAPDPDCTIS